MDKLVLKKIFHNLYKIRKLQEMLISEYHPADEMRCPVHFCLGQELMPSIIASLIKKNDNILSHHRSHGYYLASGAPIKEMIAEFYGKKTGSNGGLAGSQELSHEKYNFFSGTILSGMFAMANGTAFGDKYLKKPNISFAIIGDGGMEEGIVYESINLAAKFNLPTIFICENNSYSVHTHISKRNKINSFHKKASAFGIKTAFFNQNNPIKLYKELKEITNESRTKKTPFFIEIETYRFCSHVGPENDMHIGYRNLSEINKWKNKDPLKKIRLELEKYYKETEIKKIEAEINNILSLDLKFAKKSKFPNYAEALKNNYNNNIYTNIKKINRPTFFNPNQKETKLNPY